MDWSFEELKTLMNKLTEKDLKWTSPGGHCKLLELDEAEIRWYSNKKSTMLKTTWSTAAWQTTGSEKH